jgi:hypothetical protein
MQEYRCFPILLLFFQSQLIVFASTFGQSIEIETQSHTDVIYVLPDDKNNLFPGISVIEMSQVAQIAVSYSSSSFDFEKIQTPTTLQIYKGVSDLDTSVRENVFITFVYHSESFLAQIGNETDFHLTDQVYYYKNTNNISAESQLYEVYGIKGTVIHQEVNFESRLRRRLNFRGISIKAAHVVSLHSLQLIHK